MEIFVFVFAFRLVCADIAFFLRFFKTIKSAVEI